MKYYLAEQAAAENFTNSMCEWFGDIDDDVLQLMAGPEEFLPSSDDEAEDEIRRDTEERNKRAQDEHDQQEAEAFLRAEQDELDIQTYPFEMATTDIDHAGPALDKAYPCEDFDDESYQRIDLHKYLTAEVHQKEFFMMYNQWGTSILFKHGPHDPIRMTVPVIYKFMKSQITFAFHEKCVNKALIQPSTAYTHAILEVHARNGKEFLDMITDAPQYFFCLRCEYFLYNDVSYYSNNQMEDIKKKSVKCPHTYRRCDKPGTDGKTYFFMQVEKLIGLTSPQEPPRKKRRLFTHDSDNE